MSLLRKALTFVARFLPVRRITGGDGALYLSRYTLLNLPGGTRHLYLHQFHRSDEDRDLHNHPWTRSHSLILAGGYVEERRVERTATVPWDRPAGGCSCAGPTTPRPRIAHYHRESGYPQCPYMAKIPRDAVFAHNTTAGQVYTWYEVETRECRPGDHNVIDPDTFHRVDLREADGWSLFLTGAKLQRWGFWSPTTHAYTDYADYLTAKGLDVVADDH